MSETGFSTARANPRFSFIAEAELMDVSDGSCVIARVSELSARGCYIDMVNPLTTGTKMRFRIRYGCSTFEAPGTVLYTHSGYGMGVLFGDLAVEYRLTLEAWLDELDRKTH